MQDEREAGECRKLPPDIGDGSSLPCGQICGIDYCSRSVYLVFKSDAWHCNNGLLPTSVDFRQQIFKQKFFFLVCY